jgi:ABC-type branched-subunit amino acid transport system substrate-binding protein
VAALAGLTAAAVVIAGCSSGGSGSSPSSSSSKKLTASAPGITATTITIGSHQPLTGVAAPGYDEISPASNAYFQYVNAHGGIYGRKIVYKVLNDQYDPTITSTAVHQLVLQDNVYAVFDGLGTPTHLAVVKYLNSSKVPDVFVASGCECWNATSTAPYTTGWQIDYVREGKILGNYIKQHFKGEKIGYFYQDDEFGQDGVKGLDDEIPKAQVVARQSYNPAVTNVAPGHRAQGGRGPGRGLVQRARVHRAAQARFPQAELQSPAGRQRRRLGPDHAGRAAGVVRQAGRGQGVR